MSERSGSHYWDLLQEYKKLQDIGSAGTGLLELPPIMPRTTGSDIFYEGERFSGISQNGNAESCLTIVAGPHVKPTVHRNDFLYAAETAFGKEVNLPSSLRSNFLSPQVCVWYRQRFGRDEEQFDFNSIYSLSRQEKESFYDVIGRNIHKGALLLTQAKGKPTIWGTWGAATAEERMRDGTSRGGPTMKRGHVHVSTFDLAEQDIVFDTIDKKKELTHLAPWVALTHSQLREPLRETLEHSVSNAISGVYAETTALDKSIKYQTGTVALQKGYHSVFDRPIPIEQAMNICVELSGSLEEIYQYSKNLYETYYRSYGDENTYEALVSQMGEYYESLGMHGISGMELAKFILKIQPTYAQLKRFVREPAATGKSQALLEKKLKKYERFRDRMKTQTIPYTAAQALMYDTFKNPEEDANIDLTWPAHASFCYVIDDYNLDNKGITVNSLKLFPDFVTTEAAVERMLGVVLQRPTTQAVPVPSFKLPELADNLPVAA